MLPEPVWNNYHGFRASGKDPSDTSLSSRLLRNKRFLTPEEYAINLAQSYPHKHQGLNPYCSLISSFFQGRGKVGEIFRDNGE